MIVVPIVAAAGLTIPKTSSRSITSPAGTADTMEVLAKVDIELTKMYNIVKETKGCIVWGGGLDLSPADDLIIHVEHPLELDSEGQMIASILSKKKSAGSSHVLIDIPIGKTAKVKDIYNFRSKNLWLRRLENHGRKERVVVEDYTIEHILPQNKNLSNEWQAELGADWQRIQETWLHTLGNLTLTGYNSEYSDHPFAYKRDEVMDKDGNLVGFAHSPLKLNIGLGKVAVWNEDAIKLRAKRLADEAAKVWSSPQLPADVLDAYRPAAAGKQNQAYSIDDHPHLLSGPMRVLFEALRKEVLALDPCVNEEFLKLYVAYKAETNFVDVVPQTKRLRLSLNMAFHEIDDPKGLCVNVTDLGRWGNGDVEIGLATIDDLPYVMGLIRQSFDHQMDNTQDA